MNEWSMTFIGIGVLVACAGFGFVCLAIGYSIEVVAVSISNWIDAKTDEINPPEN